MKEIAQYILQKLGNELYNRQHLYYVITKDGNIYGLGEYEDLIKENPSISPAHIFVGNLWFSFEPGMYYPFIGESGMMLDVYLRKYYYRCKTHFNDLKYMATIVHFLETNETFMEVIDLEIAANNTNLPKLVQEILSKKDENKNKGVVTLELDFDEHGHLCLTMKEDDEDDEDEYEKIRELEERFETQRLFDGYDFYEAYKIISKYYKEKDSSLTNEIKAINEAYQRIFQPYRVELSPEGVKGTESIVREMDTHDNINL
jgi:hypothetical protein